MNTRQILKMRIDSLLVDESVCKLRIERLREMMNKGNMTEEYLSFCIDIEEASLIAIIVARQNLQFEFHEDGLDEEEKIALLLAFIDEQGLYLDFNEYLQAQGKTLDDIGVKE